jgi:putative transposase
MAALPAGPMLHYKTVRHFDLPGHAHFLTFSCLRRQKLLTNDTWRLWLGEAVRAACDRHTMALWAFVFMPDHVHLLVRPRCAAYSMAAFLKSTKQAFARRLTNHLRAANSRQLEWFSVGRGRRGKVCQFWQAGPGHDWNVCSMEQAIEKAQYCHRNPVSRGLVQAPDRWRWSSYRWLEMGIREGEPVKVDEWVEQPS